MPDDFKSMLADAPVFGLPAPDLGVLDEGRRPPPKLALEVFGPFWAGWIADAADGAGAPADYVAGPLLAAAAALIGNALRASPWPGWAEPSMLWIGCVGSSSAGKSPGADPVIALLRALELEMAADFQSRLRTWEALRLAAEVRLETWERDVKTAVALKSPPPDLPGDARAPPESVRPRILVADSTIEKLGMLAADHARGLLFHRDELAGWLGGFDRYGGRAGSDRAFWLEAYGGRGYVIDRVKNRDPVRIAHLSIGVLGGIQSDRLAPLLNGPDDGLAGRFLWLWPDPQPPRRPDRTAAVEPALTALRRLSRLGTAPGEGRDAEPRVVTLSAEAADLFQEWRVGHARIAAVGRLDTAFGKMPGQLLRLALVLEHLWWVAGREAAEPTDISVSAIGAAAHLMTEYFQPMAERVHGDALAPEAERLAAVAAHWIRTARPEVVNARDLRRRRLPGLREPDCVRAALAELVEADWLIPAPSRAGGTRGRQREDYLVSPKLWEALK